MNILAHRGAWKQVEDKNSLTAIQKGLEIFNGVEIDVRDFNGQLVVSHDLPSGSSLTFETYLRLNEASNKLWAINIKCDGLAEALSLLLKKYNIKRYFCFDMSIPETIRYSTVGLSFFTGVNDYLKPSRLNALGSGIWLDSFDSCWYTEEQLLTLVRTYRNVCIVSEDLHGRSNIAQWKLIKNSELWKSEAVSLCTDCPYEAMSYFYD